SSCSSWSAVPTAPAPRRGRGGHGGSSPSPPPPRWPVWWRGPPGWRSPSGWAPVRCWRGYRGADRARDLLVVGAGTGIVAGAVLLSRAPWPDATGYAGDGAAPQVLTLAGLVCAGLAAAWPSVRGSAGPAVRGPSRGPRADRENQRPDGTSTSA